MPQVKIALPMVVLKTRRQSVVALALLLLCVSAGTGCNMAAQTQSSVESTEALAQATQQVIVQSADSDINEQTGRPGADIETAETASRVDVLAPATTQAEITPVSRDSPAATEALVATHRVVPGDTLTRIAGSYGVSVASLLGANNLANPDLLEVGQIITLPEPPVANTSSFLILPDSRLVRSVRAKDFDIERYLDSAGGALGVMTVTVTKRNPDGSIGSGEFAASDVIERVSLEYSVDARVLLAFLEHFAGLVTQAEVAEESRLFPILPLDATGIIDRAGLYAQLSWLADRLNHGYYGWKYRGEVIVEMPDGSRLFYAQNLNAGTVAIQRALSEMPQVADFAAESSEAGIYHTYQELFGDPFAEAYETVPADLGQPELSLPFPRGETWRFTGGFHGGWGNGSAWAAVDFAPPPNEQELGYCATSLYPATAIARGVIARLDEGVVVLDLDEDSNEGSGWTILYLHADYHDGLMEGQTVEAGNIIGYPSCLGGYTTATHLHIARRYNGEWLPADCNRCAAGVSVPPFVMSDWKVVGLSTQLYQGFMINQSDNRSAVAEQGRFTNINEISW